MPGRTRRARRGPRHRGTYVGDHWRHHGRTAAGRRRTARSSRSPAAARGGARSRSRRRWSWPASPGAGRRPAAGRRATTASPYSRQQPSSPVTDVIRPAPWARLQMLPTLYRCSSGRIRPCTTASAQPTYTSPSVLKFIMSTTRTPGGRAPISPKTTSPSGLRYHSMWVKPVSNPSAASTCSPICRPPCRCGTLEVAQRDRHRADPLVLRHLQRARAVPEHVLEEDLAAGADRVVGELLGRRRTPPRSPPARAAAAAARRRARRRSRRGRCPPIPRRRSA